MGTHLIQLGAVYSMNEVATSLHVLRFVHSLEEGASSVSFKVHWYYSSVYCRARDVYNTERRQWPLALHIQPHPITIHHSLVAQIITHKTSYFIIFESRALDPAQALN